MEVILLKQRLLGNLKHPSARISTGLRLGIVVIARASIVAGIAFALPALAHHSYAMFDREKDLGLTGTVKEWRWTNPHTWLVLIVMDGQGKAVEWSIEGQSPQVLRLMGFPGKDMVSAGDKVTVHLHPLRDGTNGGQLISATTADGKTYGGAPPKPGDKVAP